MNQHTPFLDIKSFVLEETSIETISAPGQNSSPFLQHYALEEGDNLVSPETEAYVSLLSELHDEEFEMALTNLIDEAAALYDTRVRYQYAEPLTAGHQAERMLTQHFAPLVAEAEAMFGTLATEFAERNPYGLSSGEIDTIVDRYRPGTQLTPSFEQFLGGLGNFAKRLIKNGVDLAKQGISAVAKIGLPALLKALKPIIRPMIKRVIESAINKLPLKLQPYARQLRDKLPFLKEYDFDKETLQAPAVIYGAAEIQTEFNQQAVNLLFAQGEVEQELEVARVLTEHGDSERYPIAELEQARERLVENLGKLKTGDDPTPLLEEFIPALLPALQMGVRLAGRKRIVTSLARVLALLIRKFVDPQYAPALAQAIVDTGLRLVHLEMTPAEEANAAASAVASTVEETVRRVATLPDYILDNQELLEGSTLDAFEQAAAANLPSVFSEEIYRKRPELREQKKGFWYRMRGYMKRVGPQITIRLSPYRVAELETFEGDTVGEFLEEQLGLAPGEEVEALLHLYEAIPGTRLSTIVRGEDQIPSLDGVESYGPLHPLTRDAAALLVGQPELGRDAEPDEIGDPGAPQIGQRFYYLEIPGRRLLMAPSASGVMRVRRRTQSRILLNFPQSQIVVHLYLSEVRAQEFAVKLRQRAHLGATMQRLHRIVARGVRRAFAGRKGRLKIVHGAVVPGSPGEALKRLPAHVSVRLQTKLTEWIVTSVADYLKQHAEEFIKAAEDTADGVTLVVTLANPPGLAQLSNLLLGKGNLYTDLKLVEGRPIVNIRIAAGYHRG